MSKLDLLGKGHPFIIGMVHCRPLPGSPRYEGDMQKIIQLAVEDAITLEKAGVDALIVENMGDDPFLIELETAQSTAMAAVSMAVRQSVSLPIGIDAAMNDYRCAISIAQAIGGEFVRIPVFVDTVHYGGVGIIPPCASQAVRYRKDLGAEHIRIFADIQVKHTTVVMPNISLEDSARAAQDSGADALIVTGTRIGQETPIEIIERVKKVVGLPVLAGSGVNTGNVRGQMKIADGAIIGSGLKEGGVLTNPISYELTKALTNELR